MTAKPSVESGVRVVFTQHGITEPKTAYELLALELAQRIDRGVDDRSLAAVSHQLITVLELVKQEPSPKASDVDKLIERQ